MATTVLQTTDMAMTVPERFAKRNDLQFFELPIKDMMPLETHLYWHESTDQDPANRWMREQIIELCQLVCAREKAEQQ
jgi:DNA-binding transcriptional LysR family regulator